MYADGVLSVVLQVTSDPNSLQSNVYNSSCIIMHLSLSPPPQVKVKEEGGKAKEKTFSDRCDRETAYINNLTTAFLHSHGLPPSLPLFPPSLPPSLPLFPPSLSPSLSLSLDC